MNTLPINRYTNQRFPVEIISHAVWLYNRFCLSYRAVEELLFAQGVTVTYEAIRKWCRKFCQAYVDELRHRRPQPCDKWHLDESEFENSAGTRHGCHVEHAALTPNTCHSPVNRDSNYSDVSQ